MKTCDGQYVGLLRRASEWYLWYCGSILDVVGPLIPLLQLTPWFITHAHKAVEQNCNRLAYRNAKHFLCIFLSLS
jgi:hypothetical protein